ncbi:hypothetical protein HOU02_gp512 [Caulobacter phage CcrBL9]|uniref:Uncharacterized protein n=1 Tax=Caulobacter phage CcrBL9 TaxID=2283270 RepID=A0A385EBP6_9CAUD|nr:hypothetical protein HOU02_gp512 [Caulobacter phage CcrBL9]AXQ69213.1 hypothetical protein CcrBL9_gp189 [Caulobacter phage CcrBL9]
MTTNSTTSKPEFLAANPATANLFDIARVGAPLLVLGAAVSIFAALLTLGLHAWVNPSIPVVGFGPAAFFAAVLVLYISLQSLIASTLLSVLGVAGEVMAAGEQARTVSSEDVKKFLSLR